MEKQTAVEFLIDQLESKGKSWENVSIGRIQISIKVEDYLELQKQAKEMEKQQIIDFYNQKICLHDDKEFVGGVFGGYWCPKCNRNVDSELEQD